MRLAVLMLLLLFLAGYADPPEPTQADAMLSALDGIVHGQWWIVAGAALTLVHIVLMRTPMGDWWWFGDTDARRDVARIGLAAVLAITGGLGHAWIAGGAVDAALLEAIGKTFIASTTFYVVPKKVHGAVTGKTDGTDAPPAD